MASTVVNIDDMKESLSAMGVDVESNADMLNYLAATFELNEDKAEFCNYAMQEMDITMGQASAIYEHLNKSIAEGSSAWTDLAGKINDSEGACQKMADIMNDNLDGTLKTIGSALEELALQFGEILLPVFKTIAAGLVIFIQHLQGLSKETKTVIAVVSGVLAAVAAKALGAKVYISDIAEQKLQYAYKEFQLDGMILNEGAESFEKQVNEITNGNGFDVTIEAVGLPSTFQNCIDAAAFGARVVLIGVGKKNLDFNFTLIQKKELNVFGSRNALKKDFLELIDIVKEGKVDLEKIVTNTYKFEEAKIAFEDFANNGASMLKVLIEF